MRYFVRFVMTATMVATTPLWAQSYSAPTGSLFKQPDAARLDTSANTALLNARMLASLGACLADRYTITTRQFLDAVPGSALEQKTSRYFETTECIENARMRIGGETFREALFTGMYLHDFGGTAPPLPIADVKIDYAVGKTSANQAHVLLMQFGDCVNRIDPAANRAFLLSPAGSAEENARIGAIGPAMSQCLAPGARLTFGHAALRGYLGEAAYRLAKATLAQTAAKAN